MRYLVAPWADGLAITHVAAALLEQQYGYKVDVAQTEVAVGYASIGEGKGDAWSLGYFEGREGALKGQFKGGHSSYMPKIADKVEVLGVAAGPIQQGFAVPDYVDVKTVEDLNKNADKFNGQIVGMDPGTGLMQAADKAIKEYGIKLRLLQGSEASMVAALKRAAARKEWIVITAYSPHPMWRIPMRYIPDPKKVFGEDLYFFTIVRKGFGEDLPEARRFFQNYHIPNEATTVVMSWMDDGMQPREAALKWIAENRGKSVIEKWF
jgi:glycine betaine/proline transport system substrate-binding protein